MRCTAGLPFLFSEGMEIHLVPPVLDAPRVVTVADADVDGVDGGIVWFDEISTADDAKALVGCHCLIPRADVDELTHRAGLDDEGLSIIGWEAYDSESGYLGFVSELREMPGQTMIIIDRSTCDPLMVPLVDEFIEDVDEEASVLRLSLPSGLLSL